MSIVSTLIGEVVNGKPVWNRNISGEDFCTIEVSFRDTVIPVLFSSLVYDKDWDTSSKVSVTGCLISDIRDGKLPVFYFLANSIKSVDMDLETTNEINFSCTVTKVRELKMDSRCTDILPLVASDWTPLDTTSILYLTVRAATARKLKDKKKGYKITGKGYLKEFRDIYEISVNTVDNLDEICD